MFILNVCEDVSILTTILFIKKILKVIVIAVPALLVLLLSIDFAKAVISKDDDNMAAAQKLAIKRIIYAILVFFVPTIVNALFNMLGDNLQVFSCYNNADAMTIENFNYMDQELEMDTKSGSFYDSEIDDSIIDYFNKQEKSSKRYVKKKGSVEKDKAICKSCSSSERIAQTAEYLAWPKNTSRKKYITGYHNKNFKKWSQLYGAKPTKQFMTAMDKVMPGHFKWGTSYPAIKTGQSCDTFVGVVVAASGYDKIGNNHGSQHSNFTSHKKKWKLVKKPSRGDICVDSKHVKIYLGKGKVAEASYGTAFGHISKGGCSHSVRIWHAKK